MKSISTKIKKDGLYWDYLIRIVYDDGRIGILKSVKQRATLKQITRDLNDRLLFMIEHKSTNH